MCVRHDESNEYLTLDARYLNKSTEEVFCEIHAVALFHAAKHEFGVGEVTLAEQLVLDATKRKSR